MAPAKAKHLLPKMVEILHKEKTMICKQCGKPLTDHRCIPCQLVATHWNEKTGEVYSWAKAADYDAACEDLQNQLDDAFCHQYFEDY